jgi:hypothetical protein
MLPDVSRAESASESLRHLLRWLSGGCVALPCMIQESPERAELIHGDADSDNGEIPEFDAIRLLSYNIFIRMLHFSSLIDIAP